MITMHSLGVKYHSYYVHIFLLTTKFCKVLTTCSLSS